MLAEVSALVWPVECVFKKKGLKLDLQQILYRLMKKPGKSFRTWCAL